MDVSAPYEFFLGFIDLISISGYSLLIPKFISNSIIMTIETSWHQPYQVLHLNCIHTATLADIAKLNQDVARHLQQVPAGKKITAIVDCTHLNYALLSASELYEGLSCLRQYTAIRGAAYIGVRHHYIFQIIRLTCLLFRIKCYRVNTLAEAYHVLGLESASAPA